MNKFKVSSHIDWKLLGLAQNYYESLGFQYTEVPWIAPSNVIYATKQHNDRTFELYSLGLKEEKKYELVGSAEQGFLSLLEGESKNKYHSSLSSSLVLGTSYFSISPCFRSEVVDELHQNWFIKLELFHPLDRHQIKDTKQYLDYFIYKAKEFFVEVLNDLQVAYKVEQVPMDDGSVDIILNGIEIGSYGIRVFNNTSYVYGTGLALPRFSQAVKKGDI